MQEKITKLMQEKAAQLLDNAQVDYVLGFKQGEFFYDNSPCMFSQTAELGELVFNNFCAPTLSKYLIDSGKNSKKVAVFLRACDSYNFNQLLKENRIKRELVHAISIPCVGMLDINKLKAAGVKNIKAVHNNQDGSVVLTTAKGDVQLNKVEYLMEKCLACRLESAQVEFDEVLCEAPKPSREYDRFAKVKELEALSPQERFEFWQQELSKCIRCNACKDICPACSCEKCVFDNASAGMDSKANTTDFEEQMYHIVRAFHVAGRCTDCGECSRICPQGIPLYLLNRKFIADINEFYGEYQAGADSESRAPLLKFELDDVETTVVSKKEEN